MRYGKNQSIAAVQKYAMENDLGRPPKMRLSVIPNIALTMVQRRARAGSPRLESRPTKAPITTEEMAIYRNGPISDLSQKLKFTFSLMLPRPQRLRGDPFCL